MANIKSQEKRNKQNEKRRVKNAQIKSKIRTASKNLMKAIENKDTKDSSLLTELFKKFNVIVDTAASKRILHKNTAARKKSRLAKKVNSVLQQS